MYQQLDSKDSQRRKRTHLYRNTQLKHFLISFLLLRYLSTVHVFECQLQCTCMYISNCGQLRDMKSVMLRNMSSTNRDTCQQTVTDRLRNVTTIKTKIIKLVTYSKLKCTQCHYNSCNLAITNPTLSRFHIYFFLIEKCYSLCTLKHSNLFYKAFYSCLFVV